jgi:hypothetical protein
MLRQTPSLLELTRKLELVVNIKTAKALGLTIPQSIASAERGMNKKREGEGGPIKSGQSHGPRLKRLRKASRVLQRNRIGFYCNPTSSLTAAAPGRLPMPISERASSALPATASRVRAVPPWPPL